MFAFPCMLTPAAKRAGMEVPKEFTDQGLGFSKEDYPHFAVFCTAQLGRRMLPDDPWINAKIISAIPDDEIKLVTPEQLHTLGFRGI